MTKQQLIDILKSTSDHRRALLPKIKFWRTAQESMFGECFFNPKVKDEWLYKLEIESPESHERRRKFCKDFGWTRKIIDNFKGYFFNDSNEFMFEGPSQIVDKMNANIDNQGSNVKKFIDKIIEELLCMPQVDIVTDAPQEAGGMPYSYIVKQEETQDESIGLEYDYEMYRFRAIEEKTNGLVKSCNMVYYGFTNDLFYIGIDDGKNFNIEAYPNKLKYIPIRKVCISSVPVIDPVAKIQLDQMNLLTELRHIISMQAINILAVPKSAEDSTDTITTTSRLIYSDTYTGPKPDWIAYPAAGLDAHFNYNKLMTDSIYETSNLKRKQTNQAESADAKELDFMDVKSVLNRLADAVEGVCEKIAVDWSNYTGQKITSDVHIDRESFDYEGAAAVLDNTIKAMNIGFGNKAEKEIKKRALIRLLPGLDDEKMDEIEDELENPSPVTEGFIGAKNNENIGDNEDAGTN